MKRSIFFYGFYLAMSCAYAQLPAAVSDTTGIKDGDAVGVKIDLSVILHYTSPETGVNGMPVYFKPDSSLDEIQQVQPAMRYFYNDLSNLGSASDPQIFKPNTGLLTYFGNSSYDLYKWRPENIRYFKANKKFSEITYHQGSGKEQEIKFSLSENITKDWNTGFDFKRMKSLLFLNRGTTFHTNFDVYTWLQSRNSRYRLFASAIWNSFNNELNGGIADDSIVNTSNFSNSEIEGVRVNLNNSYHHVRNHIFSLNQFYDFGVRRKSEKDSAVQLPSFRLRHDLSYESANTTYFGSIDDTSLYKSFYFEPVTHDSLHYNDFRNEISLTNYINPNGISLFNTISYQLGAGYQFFEYGFITDSSAINTLSKYSNTFADGRLRTGSKDEKVNLNAGAQVVINGDNKEGYTYDGLARIALLDSVFVEMSRVQSKTSPSLFQKYYLSNHYIWANQFADVHSTILKAEIQVSKYFVKAGIQQNSIKDYIYFNSMALPEQMNGLVNIIQTFIQKDFHFWRFRFNNFICWQKSDRREIHVPDVLSHNILLYEYGFFKNKLFAQIGTELHYTSGYYSNAYSPAETVFFLQDSVKTNGYPLIDFFVNFRIKRARVFFKMKNMNDDFGKKVYYQTPHYPMPGRTFLFGVNWRFYD